MTAIQLSSKIKYLLLFLLLDFIAFVETYQTYNLVGFLSENHACSVLVMAEHVFLSYFIFS